jgi:uncharacterized membrane protein
MAQQTKERGEVAESFDRLAKEYRNLMGVVGGRMVASMTDKVTAATGRLVEYAEHAGQAPSAEGGKEVGEKAGQQATDKAAAGSNVAGSAAEKATEGADVAKEATKAVEKGTGRSGMTGMVTGLLGWAGRKAVKAVGSKAAKAVGERVVNAVGEVGEKVGLGGAKGDGAGGGDETRVTSIVESIDIGAPVHLVYDQWTSFEDFPTFMKKVENVKQESDERLTWKAQIFWSHRSWTAEIIEQVPDRRIVWRSEAEKGHVDGAVTFHELGPELTRVLLVLEYHPQGFFEQVGNLWRAQGRRARLELKHFRRHVMTRALLHPEDVEGWRGEIHEGQVVEDGTSQDQPGQTGKADKADQAGDRSGEHTGEQSGARSGEQAGEQAGEHTGETGEQAGEHTGEQSGEQAGETGE